MRILICIPVYCNVEVTRECLNSITFIPEVDILILNNGGDEHITALAQEFIKKYQDKYVGDLATYYKTPRMWLSINPTNEYVTRPWNLFLDHMNQNSEWDKLIIMNNDLTMQLGWFDKLKKIWEEFPDLIIVPTVSDDKMKMFAETNDDANLTPLTDPPGIFITLSKDQVRLIYPIPEEIKIWFNDSYMFGILREVYRIAAASNVLAYHHTSTTVNSDWAHRIIEEDKVAWENVVKPRMIEKINNLKNN